MMMMTFGDIGFYARVVVTKQSECVNEDCLEACGRWISSPPVTSHGDSTDLLNMPWLQ